MLKIGKYNLCKVRKLTSKGVELVLPGGTKFMLENQFVERGLKAGDKLKVFVFPDKEGKIAVTTQKPIACAGEFAYLQVLEVKKKGALVDWGLNPPLWVPGYEQRQKMFPERKYLVYVHYDTDSGNVIGSTKIARFLQTEDVRLRPGKKVSLLICDAKEFGVTVIVNNKYRGMLYKNEIFRPLEKGERVTGYVKGFREDGKVDVCLQKFGYKEVRDAAQKLLRALSEKDGFLPLTDNSRPAEIYEALAMSKKTFKRALGNLYKRRKIRLEKQGIRLVVPVKKK